jgi:tripartite-type tricarboxylate transporter receptor subunit TctC
MKPLRCLLLALYSLLTGGGAFAQANYPDKPIRIIVGFPAGSSADVAARVVGQKLAEAMGQPVMVENLTGAAGNIATERVARAAPDGYTLAFAAHAQIITNPSLYKLTFDPVKDLAPISRIYVSPNLLVVHNAVPAKSVEDLLTLARAQPGELTYASGGAGSSPHLAAEMLKSMAGVDIRNIPYKGVVAAIPDLLGGRVTMMFSPMPIVLPLVREGKLRALAVTSLRRSAAAPELPTVDESGLRAYEVDLWGGLLAPAGTPAAILRKLHLETVRALAFPDVQSKFADLGMEAIGDSPEEFAATISSETSKWAKVIRLSRITPE